MTITALKHIVVIKGVSIHISTSPSPYLGYVGCHRWRAKTLSQAGRTMLI
jgi:hypothetical protein